MLTLHEATIRFGGLTAVDHVGFTVEKGADLWRHRPQRRGKNDAIQSSQRRT